jgi:hypothetical protein
VEPESTKKPSKWGLVRALKTFLSVGVDLHSARKVGNKKDGITHESIGNQFNPGNMKKPSQGIPQDQSPARRLRKDSEVSNFNKEQVSPLRGFPEEEKTLPAFAKALDNFRHHHRFMELVATGGKFALDEMIEIIPKTPGSYSRASTDARHILTKVDQFGRAPLGNHPPTNHFQTSPAKMEI